MLHQNPPKTAQPKKPGGINENKGKKKGHTILHPPSNPPPILIPHLHPHPPRIRPIARMRPHRLKHTTPPFRAHSLSNRLRQRITHGLLAPHPSPLCARRPRVKVDGVKYLPGLGLGGRRSWWWRWCCCSCCTGDAGDGAGGKEGGVGFEWVVRG